MALLSAHTLIDATISHHTHDHTHLTTLLIDGRSLVFVLSYSIITLRLSVVHAVIRMSPLVGAGSELVGFYQNDLQLVQQKPNSSLTSGTA